MIAMYAGGIGDGELKGNLEGGDSNYALRVLKELGEAEDASECFICSSEIFDEVLLPCYHRGYVAPCSQTLVWLKLNESTI
jgi:DNA repair protein RAD5